jgi:dATP pyrophosphohydrolase
MNVRDDMVAVFVVRPDVGGSSHEFLQLKRAPTNYMGDTWQIVRGGIDEGERATDAALRELREETGLSPREFYRLGCIESFYTAVDDTLWHAVPFCAIVGRDDAVRLNEEHVDFRWVARHRIGAESMWASERRVLDELMRDVLDESAAKPHLRIDRPT